MKKILFLLTLVNILSGQTYVDTIKPNSHYDAQIGQTLIENNTNAVYTVDRHSSFYDGQNIVSMPIYTKDQQENLLKYSNDLSKSVWNKNGRGRPVITKNIISDPFNQHVNVITFAPNSNYRVLSQEVDFKFSNEKYFLSFYYKNINKKNQGELFIYFQGASLSIKPSLDTSWQFIQLELNPDKNDLLSSLQIRFFNYSDQDEIAFSRMSLTRDIEKTYLQTNNLNIKRGFAYANWKLKNNEVYWSELPKVLTLVKDSDVLNYLMMLGQKKVIKNIIIDQKIVLDETVYYREGVNLYSNYSSGKVTPKAIASEPIKIVCDINDANKNCFEAIPPDSEKTFMSGQIKNILFETVSDCNTVLDLGGAHFGVYEDIMIIANYYAKHGFRMGREAYTDSLAPIGNTLDRVRVYYASDFAFMFENIGQINYFNQIHAHRSKAGIYSYGPFSCEKCHIEKIDSIALDLNGRENDIIINQLYVESPNYQGDYTTISIQDTVAVKLTNAFNVSISFSKLSNNLSTLHTFQVNDVDNLFLDRNSFLFVKPTSDGLILNHDNTNVINNYNSGIKKQNKL